MSMNRPMVVIVSVHDLYQRLLERLQEDIDADDINSSMLFSSGYSFHHLLSWWFKHALSEVLALPISPTHREPVEDIYANYLKRILGDFETDILGYLPAIRRVHIDQGWVDVTVVLDERRLTLMIH